MAKRDDMILDGNKFFTEKEGLLLLARVIQWMGTLQEIMAYATIGWLKQMAQVI